jgi:hypothetical protein
MNVHAGKDDRRHVPLKSPPSSGKCQSTWLCHEWAYKAYRMPKKNWFPKVHPNLRKP